MNFMSYVTSAFVAIRLNAMRSVLTALGVIIGVAAITGSLSVSAPIVCGNRNWTTRVTGTSADFPFVRNWEMADGYYFTAEQVARGAKVAVLGASVEREVFGGGIAIGEQIRIGDAFHLAFAAQIGFEFGENAQHVEEGFPRRCRWAARSP